MSKNRIESIIYGASSDVHASRESPMAGGPLKFSTICDDPYEELVTVYSQGHLQIGEAVQNFFGAFTTSEGIVAYDSVGQQLSELRERVQYLESLAAQLQEHPTYFDVKKALADVESIAREVFGDFELSEHEDFEVAGQTLFEVTVRCANDIDEIEKRQQQWYLKVGELPLNVRRLFHLSVDPVD
jgi:hypothetical protein